VALLSRGSPEWIRAWNVVRFEDRRIREAAGQPGPGDQASPHPETGETWQYMGTHREPGGPWVHRFRHRTHPATGERATVDVPALSRWAPALEAIPNVRIN
jgi:hypothetical protein